MSNNPLPALPMFVMAAVISYGVHFGVHHEQDCFTRQLYVYEGGQWNYPEIEVCYE